LRASRANILLATATLVALLAGIEAALRASGAAIGARSDPVSPYGARYLPDSPFVLAGENRVRGRTNALGFHDRPFLADAGGGRRHIAFFGDSFVEAMQVEADSTFVSRLEDLANAASIPLEASAFGISGSGADQSFFRCRRVLQEARVDEVVYVFYMNDFFDGFLEEQKPATWPFLARAAGGAACFRGSYQADRRSRTASSLAKPILKELYLPAFVSYRLHVARARQGAGAGGFLEATSDSLLGLYFLGDGAPPRHLAARAHWEDVVRVWSATCAANGTVFRVLYMPPVWETDDSTFAAIFGTRVPRHGLSEWLRSFCEREGIPFLDPTDRFTALEGGRGTRLYWAHLNYEGHRALARFLIDELGEQWRAAGNAR
jgi:hypothetical protein